MCQLTIFEAARRFLWGLKALKDHEQIYGVATYKLIEQLCSAQEVTEVSICKHAKIFSTEQMSYDKVSAFGYEQSAAYCFLKESDSIEAHYEMCTILCEQAQRVEQLTKDIRDEWLEKNPTP